MSSLSSEQQLLKVYSDRSYVHTTTVRHQGTTVALAMDDQRRLVYSVLDLTRHDDGKGELDAAYWSENPLPLRFPTEISDVGFAAVGATALPAVKRGGRVEAAPGERLDDDERDPFLSTTARLTALAPFHALSDGTHIVVLRQSVAGDHPDAVHKVADGGSSGDPERTDYVKDRDGAKVPLVADTLLCDRFLLVDGELKPVLEARYRRSRHKTRPDSAKDSLGTADMEGRPFHEPTQELSFVRNLSGGRFTALLVPTAVHGRQRWQLFAHNDASGRIDSFNIEQSGDGLFNLQGTQAWTSPDPAHRDAVYEPAPGTCPFTGQPLVPVVSTAGYAETALRFGEDDARVRVADAPSFAGDFTVEFWARRTATDGREEFLVGHGDEKGADRASLHIGFRDDGRFTFAFYADDLTTEARADDTDWHHWACVYQRAGRRQTVYRDGEEIGSRVADDDYTGTGPLVLGKALWHGSVRAELDEVRVWDRARTAGELTRDKGIRLIGNDPGLTAYYRFDEGSGTRLHDQTDHGRHGELHGGPRWVTSEAPLGDHPGVRRDSFTVAGRSPVSGLSAVLYHQQEDTAVGYEQTPKPVKRQARVLVSYATSGPDPKTGAATDEAYLATVDFGVGRDGRLAQIPDELSLPVLSAPEASGDVEAISALDAQVRHLDQQAAIKETELARLKRQTADPVRLREEGEALRAELEGDLTAWLYRLRFKLTYQGKEQYLAVRDDGYWGAPVVRTADKDARYAVWAFNPVDDYQDGHRCYQLRSTKGLDAQAEGGSRDNGAPLALEPRDNRHTRLTRFTVREQGDGHVVIVNRDSGRAISAIDHISTERGVQYDCDTVTRSGEGLIVLERTTFRVDADSHARDLKERVEAIGARLPEAEADSENISRLQRELAALQAELAAKREELARLTGGLKGADDIALSVPRLSLDRTGLSCCGALLEFARGADRPYLLDSATGNVVLYFRGANGQFFAAYHDTQITRSSRGFAAGDGTALTFTARDAGTDLGDVTIRIMDVGDPGRCELTVEHGDESEIWRRLPRRAADFAAIVNGAPGQNYDYTQAESNRPGVPLSAGSRLVFADAGAATEVPLGAPADLVPGYGGRWRADRPGRAYAFDGRQNIASTRTGLDHTTSNGDLTIEAWVNPERVREVARVVHANTGDSPFTLGLLAPPTPPAAALSFDGKGTIGITTGRIDLADTDFTVEFWARRPTPPQGKPQIIVGHGTDSTGETRRSLHIGFRADGVFTFAFYGDDLDTEEKYTDTEWHHWACVYRTATREQVIYRDGTEIARRVADGHYQGEGPFSFGSSYSGWVPDYTRVDMDEVRLWGTARTAAEVRDRMRKRLTGDETGLAGYWPYVAPAPTVAGKPGVADRSAKGRDAAFRQGFGTVPAPTELTQEESGYRIVAGVGDRLVASRAAFPLREWSHLAVAYEQSWAVELTGGACLEVPDNDALDIVDDLTVEVFCRVDALGTAQGLLSKGRAADGAGGSMPYRLLVLPDGRLEFGFEEPDGKLVRFTSTEALTAGAFHRIAVVRKSGRSMQEHRGTKEVTAVGPDGKPVTQQVELVESVESREWQDIRFFVDGREAGTARYEGPGAKGNSGTLDIGRAHEGMETYAFTGVVAEVRVWGTARDAARLGSPVTARDHGITAHWTFEENAGNTAADTTGSHPARLRGARWTRNPDPRGSLFRLYRNGTSVACDPLEPTSESAGDFGDYGDEALCLGAMLKDDQPVQPFQGVLEDVRLWRTARTQEQLLDNLFTRLKGEKQDLLAYWSFDRASTDETADLIRDEGLRGNHLTLPDAPRRPTAVLSTAPVSSDTAQVRSALAAMRTPFHETIDGSPAVTEYADMQYTAKGDAFGVLKRAYGYLRDGRWHLVTGYKVGDLISEWISQVQFDPQLTGYVEGAPPVPSENLTPNTMDPERSTYDGVAAVELTQAEEVVHSLSSARERSVDAAFGFALSNEVYVDMWMITAPLGFGVAKSMAKAKIAVGARGSLEFSNSWAEDTAVSQGENTTRATKVELAGSWEDPRHLLNPSVGRRYVPANMGFALVQSQTADLFALRLAHNGALVAYRIQPNLDIPKDWNVIPFPLNPRYTKQGTLDGTIGYDERGQVQDPDYAHARDHGEYSYHKPREAYAIKRRIQRDRQRLRSYYETVSTETHTADPTAERAGRVLG
ncbi:LamG-like jellyroll fold domain-containing protein, partial [Streptomyces sp. NPDC056149]|uniref:LamG-like jellyroll fold domain-containing protein n=1 Tax=Streptomyces sp. NPDC056149 TaxID=3345728 RepID=UPI0035DCEE6A